MMRCRQVAGIAVYTHPPALLNVQAARHRVSKVFPYLSESKG